MSAVRDTTARVPFEHPPTEQWLSRYETVVGAGTLRALEALARKLRGHRIVMVNTTKTGGGVAEILHRVVVILNELGVPTSWEVMEGDDRFFGVTKRMHNALHGHVEPLTEQDREIYHERTRIEADRLALDGDLIFIHDPQPAALIEHRRRPGQKWVWRCHIYLSRRDPAYWEFLQPYVAQNDASILSHIAFVPPITIPSSSSALLESDARQSSSSKSGCSAPRGSRTETGQPLRPAGASSASSCPPKSSSARVEPRARRTAAARSSA